LTIGGLERYLWRVIRTLLLASILALSLVSVGHASSSGPALNPGRDAELERSRRGAPLGPWGPAPWLVLALAAGWATRRAVTEGEPMKARRLVAVTGVLLGFASAEVLLRLSVDQWATHVKVRDGCYHDNPRDYFERVTYLDDPATLAWCAGPLTDVWAGCEAETAVAAQAFHRIMALGDSFTDGVGVFARDTWPARLDALLETRARVVNCGKASSFTSHTAKRYLSHRERHRPDTVVYAFVLNDVPLAGASPPNGADIGFQFPNRQVYAEAVAEAPLWGPLVQQSALARLVSERLANRNIHQRTMRFYEDTYAPTNSDAFDAAMDLIGAMDELVTKGGGHFLVVLWPLLESLEDYPFKAVHQRLRDSLAGKGIAHLDLLSSFAGRDAAGLHVHPTDHHPNELAHQLAAGAIAADLERREWLSVSDR
jgi:lysophospholipase L1-like esterase